MPPWKFLWLSIEHSSKIFLQPLSPATVEHDEVSEIGECLTKGIKTSLCLCSIQSFHAQKQIAPPTHTPPPPPLKNTAQDTARQRKNPSWQNFLKRMNSIDHTDGTLSVRETGKDRESESDTDIYGEIYRQRCARCGRKGRTEWRGGEIIGRKRMKRGERGMRFLFLSRAFITSVELILVVPLSLGLSCPSLFLSLYLLSCTFPPYWC